MEILIHHYLRILDIDPFGYSIRLINISHNESLDLSNICIRQFKPNIHTSESIEYNSILNSYTFSNKIHSLLNSGQVVSIFSSYNNLFKVDSEPYIFIAHDISRWSTECDVRTDISIDKSIFDSYRTYSTLTGDVPLVFTHRTSNLKHPRIKITLESSQHTRFVFPYCLSTDNMANPYTSAISTSNKETRTKNLCDENRQIVKHFNSYARRLTTEPKIIRF